MIDGGLHENFTNWQIRRSPAISSADWGTVAVEIEIIGGRGTGSGRCSLPTVRNWVR